MIDYKICFKRVFKFFVLQIFIFLSLSAENINVNDVNTYRNNIVNIKEFIKIDLSEQSSNSYLLLPNIKYNQSDIIQTKIYKDISNTRIDTICNFANIIKLSVLFAKISTHKIGDNIRKINKEDIIHIKNLFKTNNKHYTFETISFENKLQKGGYILYEPMRHKKRTSKYYRMFEIVDVIAINNNFIKRPKDPQIIIIRDLILLEYYIVFRSAFPKDDRKTITNLPFVLKIFDSSKKYHKKNSYQIKHKNDSLINVKLNKFAYEGIVKPTIERIIDIIEMDAKKHQKKTNDLKITFLGQSMGALAAQISLLCFTNAIKINKNKLSNFNTKLECYVTGSPKAMDSNGYKVLKNHNIFITNIIIGKKDHNRIILDPVPFFTINTLSRAHKEIVITKNNIWLLKPENVIKTRKHNLSNLLKLEDLHMLRNLKHRISKILSKIGYCDVSV